MLKIIISIAVFIFLLSFLTFLMSIFPPRHVTSTTPKEIGRDYEDFYLKTKDNIKLHAWFIPNNKTKKAIIICHGYPFDKGNVLGFAEFLDYNLLFFDFRRMGKSKGFYTTAGYKEINDFNAAVEFLSKKNMTIGTLGFSLGASTAIMAKNPKVKAIVADSPYANLENMLKQQYRIFSVLKYPFLWLTKFYALFIGVNIDKASPADAVKEYNTPILLIHGKQDNQIPYQNSVQIHNANKNNTLWLVNANHGEAHFLHTKDYEKKVIDFFKINLR